MAKLGYTFYPKDWSNSDAVFEMTLEQRGFYRELIDMAMLNDNKAKYKPNILGRKLGVSSVRIIELFKELSVLEVLEYEENTFFIRSCEPRLNIIRGAKKGGKKSVKNKATPKALVKATPKANSNQTVTKGKETKIEKKGNEVDAPTKISLGVQGMANKYLKLQREQIDLIQMNIIREKNDELFRKLLWAFCLEQIGKVNEHTDYNDFVKHVWNWFNHKSFNAESKLKLVA